MIPLELLQVIKILILPPGLQFVMLLLGALLLKRNKRGGKLLIGVALLSLYLLSTPFVAQQITASVEIYPALDLNAPAVKQAGAIVVLGAGRYSDAPEYGGDTASYRLLERLRYAAVLHEKLGLPLLLTGGRVLEDGPSEAEIMQQTLQQSFHLEAIWLESDSRNTRENALFSYSLLNERNIQQVILVTHASHMRRAVLRFEEAGFSVIPAPTVFYSLRVTDPTYMDFLPTAQSLQLSNITLHEIIGLIAARAER